MPGNSRLVQSSQDGIHPSLQVLLARHLATPWRQPLADHSRLAFNSLSQWRRQRSECPLWMDSGCGTGRATVQLAEENPDVLVVGLDQSAARLERGRQRYPVLPDNALLLRAECADLWRLMVSAGWTLQRHYLLYPNPWPKPGHLQRRWHGHPVFPTLLALGGLLELRSNWSIYVDEMAQVLAFMGCSGSHGSFTASSPLTDFEEKYQHSDHSLYRLTYSLDCG
ncbi:MAG: SAM-dependent methyltransferase [Gammaproteobacteria bacterium HGW-Gammaproteobacteria-14]|nr:MAG: SAM-dependent methyltransferase [Gammaproteobacteria bacterium HGW-Gammaproteobacteria-14]